MASSTGRTGAPSRVTALAPALASKAKKAGVARAPSVFSSTRTAVSRPPSSVGAVRGALNEALEELEAEGWVGVVCDHSGPLACSLAPALIAPYRCMRILYSRALY